MGKEKRYERQLKERESLDGKVRRDYDHVRSKNNSKRRVCGSRKCGHERRKTLQTRGLVGWEGQLEAAQGEDRQGETGPVVSAKAWYCRKESKGGEYNRHS